MREILFRGQTRRKGEKVTIGGAPVPSSWVYGGVAQTMPDRDYSIIYQHKPYIVYADTVGQYIGITDKNDAKIFEGDIVRVIAGVESYGVYEFDKNITVKDIRDLTMFENAESLEIIGNIHDNFELLETEDEDAR